MHAVATGTGLPQSAAQRILALPHMDTSRLRELAISDTGFVFDPTTGHTYNVNATALVLLRALKVGTSMDGVLGELNASFEVEPGQDLARDVEEFVSRLREQGLIK